jgi:type VI protein secretion system component Hcp
MIETLEGRQMLSVTLTAADTLQPVTGPTITADSNTWAGKTTSSEFHIVKLMDKSTPILF